MEQPADMEDTAEMLVPFGARQRGTPEHGVAGSFPVSNQIQQALAWMRKYVGEGVEAEMRWDRSGGQSFSLFSKKDWNALALFGAYGHMQLSAKGAINLPIDSLGFGYRIDKDDITFSLDPITVNGLATRLGLLPDNPQAYSTSPVPSQLGLASVFTVLTIIRDIWLLLHPKCDLTLGGNVTAIAVLDGDSIKVKFSQAPSIRLMVLLEFDLSVEEVVLTTSNIHVDFGGSWIIKSRDFEVK